MSTLVKTPYYSFWLILFLIFKALIVIGIILYAGIGLGPDEAQYWTWSRSLDWGYYSKPPGIAWQIWLGTQAFGQTELGVRFFAIILSFLQALSIYVLAVQCELKRFTAFWCAILMAFCPIGVIGSLLAITDGGFLLFWTLACVFVCFALRHHHKPNAYLIGFCICIGALFKWPIYFFWVFYLVFYWRFLRVMWREVLGGIGISLLGLLPSVWWNASHDWATFRHVFSTMQGGHQEAIRGNVLEFIGSQIFLISPVLFGLLIFSCLASIKGRRLLVGSPLAFCALVSIGSLIAMIFMAFFQKIQGNWGIFAYPTSFILIGWYTCEWAPQRQKWLKGGIVLSVGLISGILALVYFSILPYRMNPFKHNIGWHQLSDVLKRHGFDSQQDYLVSDKYQTTSVLSFYGPEQKRAYFLNLQGMRKNQFSYWPQLQDEQKGKIGFFVWIESAPYLEREWRHKLEAYQGNLQSYFEKVEFVGMDPLIDENNKIVKGMFIFKCYRCLDKYSDELNKY